MLCLLPEKPDQWRGIQYTIYKPTKDTKDMFQDTAVLGEDKEELLQELEARYPSPAGTKRVLPVGHRSVSTSLLVLESSCFVFEVMSEEELRRISESGLSLILEESVAEQLTNTSRTGRTEIVQPVFSDWIARKLNTSRSRWRGSSCWTDSSLDWGWLLVLSPSQNKALKTRRNNVASRKTRESDRSRLERQLNDRRQEEIYALRNTVSKELIAFGGTCSTAVQKYMKFVKDDLYLSGYNQSTLFTPCAHALRLSRSEGKFIALRKTLLPILKKAVSNPVFRQLSGLNCLGAAEDLALFNTEANTRLRFTDTLPPEMVELQSRR